MIRCARCNNIISDSQGYQGYQVYDPSLRQRFSMGSEFVLYFHNTPHGRHKSSGKSCYDLWKEQNADALKESQR